MNKLIIFLVVVLVVLGGFLLLDRGQGIEKENLKNVLDVSEEVVITGENEIPFVGELFEISSEKSIVNWTGRKTLISDYSHSGTINFQDGEFFVEEGILTGGRAVFDMNSIKSLDADVSLDEHLKSEDFFFVENYPTAELFIAGAEPGQEVGKFILSGTLAMKGVTQGVSFPVTVIVENDSILIEGEVRLDRTLWDVRFGSDKFFDNLADNAIDDFFTARFKVVAEAEE